MTRHSNPATGKSSWRLAKSRCGALRAAGLAALLTACSGSVIHLGDSMEETAGARFDAAAAPASREATQIAGVFADEVDDTELADIRGGQVTIGGLEFAFGFVFETLINNALVARTLVNLIGPGGGVQTLASLPNTGASVVLQGVDGGVTQVIQQVGQGGLVSTVVNTVSDTTIDQTITLTIDVLNHTQFFGIVRSGSPLGAGRRLPNIIKDALIGAIAE